MTLSFVDVTSVPCGTCGGPSVSLRSWPDGTYVASCAEHLDEPKQSSGVDGRGVLMDIYIVLDGERLIDVSAKLQGAELIRADEAKRLANQQWNICGRDAERWRATEKYFYDRIRIVNADVKDMD